MGPEVSTCSLEDFEPYLPFRLSVADIESCTQRLLRNQSTAIMTNGKLTLPDLQSPARDVNEKIHFEGLERLTIALESCELASRTQNYRYIDTGDRKIHSDIEGSTNRIDGSIVPVSIMKDDLKGIAEHHTTNIAVACEWKTVSNAKNKLDNNIKVVSANVQIMNDDIRRMYGYGLTIEEKYLRVWYLSRSFTLVTHRIDYVEHPESLIKILISFMFATEKEMGYDPTITRHGAKVYTYEIGGRFFRTNDMISGYRSNNITGRIARIWSAEEVDSREKDARVIEGKDKCVVKDVWLKETAKTEGEIQCSLFEDIDRFWMEELPPEKAGLKRLREKHRALVASGAYRDYFLTHEVDETGETTKPYNKEKFALAPRLFAQLLGSSILSTPSWSSRQSDTQRLTVSHTKDAHSAPHQRVYDHEFCCRRQYRVVFKEKCQATIGEIEKLGEAVDLLKQTLIPLQLMFCAGWVHRDISSGNILAYREPGCTSGAWRAKLSDLEYARKFPRDDEKAGGDRKMGTPYFMALEILLLFYLADPIPPPVPKQDEGRQADPFDNPVNVPERPNVFHNFQHDLESVWWIFIWLITSRVAHRNSQEYAGTIFNNSMEPSAARQAALTQVRLDLKLKKILKKSLHVFLEKVEHMRGYLMDHYKRRCDLDQLNDPCKYIEIHNLFDKFFDSLLKTDNSASGWKSESLGNPKDLTNDPIATPAAADAGNESSRIEELSNQILLSTPERHVRRTAPPNLTLSQSVSNQGVAESSWPRPRKRQKTSK